MDVYIRKVLRVSVAQICQTIGYNSFQSIPLELLVDSLQKFLQEFSRDLHQHVELFNRTEANLDDVALTLQSLNISTGDLLEYINHVQPVSCNIDVPKLPAQKSSNLNFLKPGSKEVLTRPVHIYEHLPPTLRDTEEEEDKSNILASPNTSQLNTSNHIEDEVDRKISTENLLHSNDNSTETNQMQVDVVSKSAIPSSTTREISSVMMTSGGFISPAMEGKTPESVIPDIVEKYFGLDAPPSSPSPPPLSLQAQSNSQTAKSSLITNSAHSSLLNQNPNQNFTAKKQKINQHSDKKKLKKKTLSNLPSNNTGIAPNVFIDKAQRKRFKMLQKSMAKNSSTGSVTNLKSKSHNLSHSSQEKLLKKQLKHKQKQLRKQTIQKHTESVANITTPSIFPGSLDKGPMTHPHDISKANLKKELGGKMSAQSEDIQSAPDTDVENSTLCTSSSFLNSNAIHQQYMPTGDEQDMEALPPLLPMAHNVSGETHTLSIQSDEVKLNNEPDRSKLNIFKKISSSARKDRGDAPQIQNPELKHPASGSNGGTSIFGDSQVISLPSGTTITPAPPSGSGRHVYAPPPPSSQKSGDFNSVISGGDGIAIPEGSAVLMQRGDLMIQKPKKRGRKPGSKNQPKILGLNTKKPKKIKKSSFFGHHSSSTMMEPLNLSHNTIDNLANIPLGIASTFPIDGGINLKMKKERKKSKMGKEPGFMHNHSKSSASSIVPCGSKNMAPTKEEFGSINQKLMMMNTVLQPAPPLPSGCSSMSLPSKSSAARSTSPTFLTTSLPIEVDAALRAKKERKKQQKQIKDQQKQSLQSHHNNQVMQPIGSGESSSLYASSTQGFSNSSVPGMDGMPVFPFYPFPVRPGLIPSHNLFSQLPNMNNNGLFMPPLMGFPPLNHSIRPFFKDDKNTNSTPIPIAPEGNYSKVAPLVPDAMRLELSPGTNSTKSKTTFSPRDIGQALHNTTEPLSSLLSPGHVGVIRKKSDDHHSASITMSTVLKNSETIEVSSDDSEQDGIRKHSTMTPTFANRPAVPLTGIPSGLYRQSRNPIQPSPFASSNNHNADINIVNSEINRSSSIERRNKEHKKMKKIKQGKKQSQSSSHENLPASVQAINMTLEPSKKSEDSTANLSGGNLAKDYESLPEKRKDHKKMKKLLKEIKIKKKKDKKDKNKNKEKNPEKIIRNEKSEKEKRKDEKKDKDKLKKLKKDKKKSKEDKERNDNEVQTATGATGGKYTSSGVEGMGSGIEVSSVVPKITLKLAQSVQSPISSLRTGGKSSLLSSGGFNNSEREQSPELARISPLVTRPPKQQKPGTDDNGCSIGNMPSGPATSTFHHAPSHSASVNVLNDSVIDIDSNSGGPSTFMLPASATILGGLGLSQSTCTKPPAGTNLTCSTLHSSSGSNGSHSLQHVSSSNKHSLSSSLISEANRPISYVDTSTKDAEGNRVWICPACGKVDDGSPMIGCDGCDAWYHWVCVGILVAPDDNEDWYCRVCIAKKRGVHGGDKKRKRNKKKNSDF